MSHHNGSRKPVPLVVFPPLRAAVHFRTFSLVRATSVPFHLGTSSGIAPSLRLLPAIARPGHTNYGLTCATCRIFVWSAVVAVKPDAAI